MGNPWFRLYHQFATDPLIQALAFEDQRHYVIILCLKCEGLLDRKISPANRERIIRRTLGLDATAYEEAKNRLMELQLVDKQWQPLAWDKRQYISDNSTERVRKFRKTNNTGNVTQPLLKRDCNAPETDTEAETDKEEKSKPKKNGKFIPPTYQQVREYAESISFRLDEELFVDSYQRQGWKLANGNPVKDWKACVRTWRKTADKTKPRRDKVAV